MYLDSDAIIGCLYADDPCRDYARSIQIMAENLYTSASTLLEVAFVVMRDKKETTAGLFDRVRKEFPSLEFVPLTSQDMAGAFELQWRYGLGAFDAIHVAVCLARDSRIASTDKAFKRVDGLTIVKTHSPKS